ncbi:hypothetical protein HZC21_05130 [Candidatus Peregrinibacteria bacterium]|nr:hypothetical protein [Candidatus Peregrinibacteria bacterium]
MSHTKTFERFREPLGSALREQVTCLRSQKPEATKRVDDLLTEIASTAADALRNASSRKVATITQTVRDLVANVCRDVAYKTAEKPKLKYIRTSQYDSARIAHALGIVNTEHFLKLDIMSKLTEKIEALTQTESPDDDAE